MPVARFDDLIHSPRRLSIVSLLAASDWAEFKVIRDTIGLSDSVLSKQLSILEAVGYVAIRKTFVGKWPRTLASLTTSGRDAFEGHVLKLQEIVSPGGPSLAPGTESIRRPENPPAQRDPLGRKAPLRA